MQQQLDVILNSLNAFWSQVAGFIPKLIAAALLILAGWLVARLVRVAVRRLLYTMRFKSLVHSSGLEYVLLHADIKITVTELLAGLSFWVVMLVVVVMVSNSLGLYAVADLFNRIVLYLPNVFVAIIVLVLGSLVGRFINRMTFTWLNNMGIKNAIQFSTGAQYAVYLLTLFIALQQLGIGGTLLTSAFIILFGAICLALALAFGLGGKEWAAGVIARSAGKGGE